MLIKIFYVPLSCITKTKKNHMFRQINFKIGGSIEIGETRILQLKEVLLEHLPLANSPKLDYPYQL